MKIVAIFMSVTMIGVLGYLTYLDSQDRKRKELMNIVRDAEHSLETIQHNPHYIKSIHSNSADNVQ